MEREPPESGQAKGPASERRAAEREARLAAALRSNLRRRKAQSRARQDSVETADGSPPPPADADDGGGT